MTKLLTPKILECAKMCHAVYNPLAEHPGRFVKSESTDAELYLTLIDDTAYVVCRGTDSAGEWIQNFMWDMVPFSSEHRERSDAKIHTGFMLQYVSVKNEVFDELDILTKMDACKKVLFTGHSLGGANASILAYGYAPTCTLPIEVISFGGPRFCNSALRDIYENDIVNTTRVVNDLDGVTLAPLVSQGYCHVGNLIHIKDEKEDSKELSWFGWAFWVVKSSISYMTGSVTDHFIWNYVEEIEKCLEKNQEQK